MSDYNYGLALKWKRKDRGIVGIESLPTPYSAVVYALKDPDTNEYRSVGRTKNVMQRYSSYLSPDKGKRNPSPRDRWVMELVNNNKKPVMELLAICEDVRAAKAIEALWDVHIRSLGHDLLNADRYPVRVIRMVYFVLGSYTDMDERMKQLVERLSGK